MLLSAEVIVLGKLIWSSNSDPGAAVVRLVTLPLSIGMVGERPIGAVIYHLDSCFLHETRVWIIVIILCVWKVVNLIFIISAWKVVLHWVALVVRGRDRRPGVFTFMAF